MFCMQAYLYFELRVPKENRYCFYPYSASCGERTAIEGYAAYLYLMLINIQGVQTVDATCDLKGAAFGGRWVGLWWVTQASYFQFFFLLLPSEK
jgi:hypothetical protein